MIESFFGTILDQIELLSADFERFLESSLSIIYCNDGWVEALVLKPRFKLPTLLQEVDKKEIFERKQQNIQKATREITVNN